MKLSIVIPLMNQHELATACLDCMVENLCIRNEVGLDTEFVIIDNGSDAPFQYAFPRDISHKIVRHEESTGVYPTFWEGLKESSGDVVAFFHSDLVISEKDWDKRLLDTFKVHPDLGLVGFIGSDEIDWHGGRGLGTASNFQGGTVTRDNKAWTGSAAEIHGRRIQGLMPSAVVDGCAMVFRRVCLEQIAQRPDFPPHHFYDRLLSCEVMEMGFKVATLGIACDHISGQTVNQEPKYQVMAYEWLHERFELVTNMVFQEFDSSHNYDADIYSIAESQWLTEYREYKHLVPIKI